VSESDWYTLYFSKGFYQEGEGAARYLNSIAETLEDKTIIELCVTHLRAVRSRRGFRETWLETGHQPVASVTLKKGEILTAKVLEPALSGKNSTFLSSGTARGYQRLKQ